MAHVFYCLWIESSACCVPSATSDTLNNIHMLTALIASKPGVLPKITLKWLWKKIVIHPTAARSYKRNAYGFLGNKASLLVQGTFTAKSIWVFFIAKCYSRMDDNFYVSWTFLHLCWFAISNVPVLRIVNQFGLTLQLLASRLWMVNAMKRRWSRVGTVEQGEAFFPRNSYGLPL